MPGYQHQILQKHPKRIIHEFHNGLPYIPNISDIIIIKYEEFIVTSVNHYLYVRFIVINVSPHQTKE